MSKVWMVIVLLLAVSTSCSGVVATPAPILAATLTAGPTDTPTPMPSATAQPSPTPDLSAYQLAGLETSRGFALEIPLAFQLKKVDAGLYATDERLVYIFFTAAYDGSSPVGDSIHRFLDLLEQRGAGFDRGDPYEAHIAGRQGTGLDYGGFFINSPVTGQSRAVTTADGRVFIAVGMAKTDNDKQAWIKLGQPLFEQMLGTLSFQEASDSCVISTDESYGYSEENPIRVGGGDSEGPSREQAYLDNLRGPNGEELTYTRDDSHSSGDIVLDEFHLLGPGLDAGLYIDEYNFSDPQAPVRFTCAGAFPLSPP